MMELPETIRIGIKRLLNKDSKEQNISREGKRENQRINLSPKECLKVIQVQNDNEILQYQSQQAQACAYQMATRTVTPGHDMTHNETTPNPDFGNYFEWI